MQRELYFDISSEDNGGSLYRVTGDDGAIHFYYNHSTYDSKLDEVKVFETDYPDFASFWSMLTADKKWFYWHPLFVHPDRRVFVQDALAKVDWGTQTNKKWQESHQRQWTKVLTDQKPYYRG